MTDGRAPAGAAARSDQGGKHEATGSRRVDGGDRRLGGNRSRVARWGAERSERISSPRRRFQLSLRIDAVHCSQRTGHAWRRHGRIDQRHAVRRCRDRAAWRVGTGADALARRGLHAPDSELHASELHAPDGELHASDRELHTPDGELHAPEGELHASDRESCTPDRPLHAPDGELHASDHELCTPDRPLHAPEGELHAPDRPAPAHPRVPLPRCLIFDPPDSGRWK